MIRMSETTAIPDVRARAAERKAPRDKSFTDHALVQLTIVRFRETLREPEALFWIFAFPILLAAGLGIAVVPEAMCQLRHKSVVSRPLDTVNATTSIWLLRSSQDDSPLVSAFCKLITKRRSA